MAYSSDKPAQRGFIPPQTEEEKLLFKRVAELCGLAQSRGIPRYTGFLSDREQVLARAAANHAQCECIRFDGGYPDAERCILAVEPPDSWKEQTIAVLCITSRGGALAHRDLLGAILGLGLERACLGDLLHQGKEDEPWYAFVQSNKAELIMQELCMAGRISVGVTLCEKLPAEVLKAQKRTLRQATVSSLRADSVLAAMMQISRGQAGALIDAQKVEVNHILLRAGHAAVCAQDIFTVRGFGRYRLEAIGGKSKKDRVFISFYQY